MVESFKEPLKEILHSDNIYNENAQDIFFMEVTIKFNNNFVTDVLNSFMPIDLHSKDVNSYQICLRAYSLTRNIWIKDYQPL